MWRGCGAQPTRRSRHFRVSRFVGIRAVHRIESRRDSPSGISSSGGGRRRVLKRIRAGNSRSPDLATSGRRRGGARTSQVSRPRWIRPRRPRSLRQAGSHRAFARETRGSRLGGAWPATLSSTHSRESGNKSRAPRLSPHEFSPCSRVRTSTSRGPPAHLSMLPNGSALSGVRRPAERHREHLGRTWLYHAPPRGSPRDLT